MLYQSTNSPKDKKYGVDANGESPGFANHKILGELRSVEIQAREMQLVLSERSQGELEQ